MPNEIDSTVKNCHKTLNDIKYFIEKLLCVGFTTFNSLMNNWFYCIWSYHSSGILKKKNELKTLISCNCNFLGSIHRNWLKNPFINVTFNRHQSKFVHLCILLLIFMSTLTILHTHKLNASESKRERTEVNERTWPKSFTGYIASTKKNI